MGKTSKRFRGAGRAVSKMIHRSMMERRREKRKRWRDMMLSAHKLAEEQGWPCVKRGKKYKVKVLVPPRGPTPRSYNIAKRKER